MVTWDTDETFNRLASEFDMSRVENHWGYAHPRYWGAMFPTGNTR